MMTSVLRFGNPLRCLREDGQALIFTALVAMTLAFTTGLAIEGGRLYSEYRRLQAAADMSALVGAQTLPCGTTSSSADSSCRLNAETAACNAAGNNGFSGCTAGSTPGAVVPPVTCSPYTSIDYGNDSANGPPYAQPGCQRTTVPATIFDYIEVKLEDPLGTIPIFNVPVTLSAHAVARHGVPSPRDYAVSQLDPNGSLSVGGSFDYFVNGSTFANGTLSPGATSIGCEGGFFTAQNESDPGTEVTYSGGVAGFAPPDCYKPDGTTPWTPAANTDNWDSGLPKIPDPYCSSASPPYQNTGSKDCGGNPWGAPGGNKQEPNCPDCTKSGWYYDIDNNKWHQGGDISQSGHFELFPGVYGTLNMGKDTYLYMNPGVYTFTGNVEFDFGHVCTYGAPICDSGMDSGECGDTNSGGYASWTPGPSPGSNTQGNIWYYHCSPYGFYDTDLYRPATTADGAPATVPCGSTNPIPQGPSCTAPTFWDTTLTNTLNINGGSGGVSSVPLNGITWNLVSTSSGAIGGHGSGNSNLAFYVAAPNPCPGTGTDAQPNQVSFNNGDPNVQFTYSQSPAAPDQPAIPARAYFKSGTYRTPVSLKSPIVSFGSVNASEIYPSMDLSIAGECKNDTYEVWPGEMGGQSGQHLHFSLFDRQNNLGKFNGNSAQSLFGIVYVPGNGSSGPTYDIRGAGKGLGGPPYIWGQIVAWDISYGGNGAVDLIYRPCNDTQDPCASGIGTELIQ